jgi:hypothetical protein
MARFGTAIPNLGVFTELRQALLAQRQAIARRLEVVDEAEAAFGRLRDVFGMPSNGGTGARTAPRGNSGLTLPADPADALLESTTHEQSAARTCEECGELFPPSRHGGKPTKFCGKGCRQRANTRRRAERRQQANGPLRDVAEEEAPQQSGPFLASS